MFKRFHLTALFWKSNIEWSAFFCDVIKCHQNFVNALYNILFSNLTDYFSTNKYFTYVDVRFGNIKREFKKKKSFFSFRIDELTFLATQSARLTNWQNKFMINHFYPLPRMCIVLAIAIRNGKFLSIVYSWKCYI